VKPPRRPSVIWSLRGDLRDLVCTEAGDQIGIRVNGGTIVCDRATARLLAKRIGQCLDATTSRSLRKAARPVPHDSDNQETAP
jgi:hypothetical protein